ncbi:MAG: GDSL-type esterase/lipase family protein [Propionibacteriaceae bacterium]|nr:GDSL-type esterase/lipase family protein [Propionibacteriaceae bacterium]MDO5066904.1 GDSL-type esterase/lipase family protein [Propionibacteriaceae bacterium]
MFDRSILLRLAAVAALLLATVSPTPAAADEETPSRTLSMVLLGDSYSAGNGAGNYDSAPAGAYRSAWNWAHWYRKWLVEQGVSPHLVNLAHSGHTTEEVIKDQIDAIPEDVDIVMMTIGGNDIGFEKVIEKCFALLYRHPLGCKDVVEQARGIIRDPGPNGVVARTIKVLDAIEAKVKSMGRTDVQIILVGYPNLLLPDSDEKYILHECLEAGWFSCLRYADLRQARPSLKLPKRWPTLSGRQ